MDIYDDYIYPPLGVQVCDCMCVCMYICTCVVGVMYNFFQLIGLKWGSV